MNKLSILPAALLAAACMGEVPPPTSPEGESMLAERLGNRTAGPPQSCIRSQHLGDAEWIDPGVLLFEGRGGTLYVNRTQSPCPEKGPFAFLRTRSVGPNTCSGELIEIVERDSNISRGTCALGDFTPYRRR